MNPEQNQEAKSIENLLKEIQQDTDKVRNEPTISNSDKDENPKIDVLNLPPRREVHEGGAKANFKLSRPLIRLLIVIILVIAILVSSYYFWEADIVKLINNL